MATFPAISMISDRYVVMQDPFTRSKYPFWQNLKKGHVIQITHIFKSSGSNNNGIYVPQYTIKNLTTEEEFTDSLNLMIKRIKNLNLLKSE